MQVKKPHWKKPFEEVLELFVLEPYGLPGYAQHYPSTNYLLLTAILEQATGASVPDEVERLFLEPLELDNTFTFRVLKLVEPAALIWL